MELMYKTLTTQIETLHKRVEVMGGWRVGPLPGETK